jgi:hypothetical protein
LNGADHRIRRHTVKEASQGNGEETLSASLQRGNTVGQLATQLSPFIRGKGEDFSLDKPPLLVEE